MSVYHAQRENCRKGGGDARVHLRLSLEEAAEIEQRAAAVGQTRSRFVRDAAHGRHQMDEADRRILRLGSNSLGNLRRSAGLIRWWRLDGEGKLGERHIRGPATPDYQLQLGMIERKVDGQAKRLSAFLKMLSADIARMRGQHLQARDDALPEDERGARFESLFVRLPLEDRRILGAAASDAGITLAAYMRERAIRSVAIRIFRRGSAKKLTLADDYLHASGHALNWWLTGCDDGRKEKIFAGVENRFVIRRAVDLAKVPDSALGGLHRACDIFDELMPELSSDRKKVFRR